MKINHLTDEHQQWDKYVESHPAGTIYHTIAWKNIVEQHFKKKTKYIFVKNADKIYGVLPLVIFDSRLFGRSIVSYPYVNYGGMLYSDDQAKALLLEEAQKILSTSNSEYIELRSMQAEEFDLPVKTKKVTYYLSLPDNEEALMKRFKAKLRSQIRRPIKEGMYGKLHGHDGLEQFYSIFSKKMRDLGTPVYDKQFFSTIFNEISDHANIVTIYSSDHIPVASAFVIHYKNMMEIPWAATLRSFDKYSPNMLLYFEVLKTAIGNQCGVFDFGRCTKGSGTYRFKKQWGGQEKTLYWYYLLGQGQEMPEVNTDNPKYKLAIKVWRNMPLIFTNLVGPSLVRHIP